MGTTVGTVGFCLILELRVSGIVGCDCVLGYMVNRL